MCFFLFLQELKGDKFEIALDRKRLVASIYANGEFKGTSADRGLHFRSSSLVVKVPNNETVAVVFRSGFVLQVNNGILFKTDVLFKLIQLNRYMKLENDT